MRYIPCEPHRRLQAELEDLIQSTTTAEELASFRGDQKRLFDEIAGCSKCEKLSRPAIKLTKADAEALLRYVEVAAAEELARMPAGPYQRGDAHTSVLAGLSGILEFYAGRETDLFKVPTAAPKEPKS